MLLPTSRATGTPPVMSISLRPPPSFALEIGVAFEVVTQSILRVLGLKGGGLNATV